MITKVVEVTHSYTYNFSYHFNYFHSESSIILIIIENHQSEGQIPRWIFSFISRAYQFHIQLNIQIINHRKCIFWWKIHQKRHQAIINPLSTIISNKNALNWTVLLRTHATMLKQKRVYLTHAILRASFAALSPRESTLRASITFFYLFFSIDFLLPF